jgi:hypothetical protein
MKLIRETTWAVLLAGCLIGTAARSQTTNTDSVPDSSADRSGRVLQTPGVTEVNSAAPSVARPERPEQQLLPLDLRQRVANFEAVRETYLAEQRELLRKLQGATEEDREKIRELIKSRREVWLEQARRFREEAKERMAELKNALPSHKEALEAARDNAREKLQDARERRGTD